MIRLILASGSSRRRDLLETWQIPFVQAPAPEVEETFEGEPEHIVTANARRKVGAYLTRLDDPCEVALESGDRSRPPGRDGIHDCHGVRKLVLGVDTIVVQDRHVMGKPRDVQESKSMIETLSANRHQVYSGIHLAWADGSGQAERHDVTEVQFRPLGEDEIGWYVATGEGMDKAGSYGIQGRGGVFVSGIVGCYFNVVGFPIGAFTEALRDMGIDLATLRREGERS